MPNSPENLRLFPEPEMPIDPRSGLKRNAEGEIVDDKGNVYDERGEHIVKEAPEPPSAEFSAELARLKKDYPNSPEEVLRPWAKENLYRRSKKKKSGRAGTR